MNGYFLRENSEKTGQATQFRFLNKRISECLTPHAIILS